MILLTRTYVHNKKFNKQTHNLLLNLCIVGMCHFRTFVAADTQKIPRFAFWSSRNSSRDRCLHSNLQTERRLNAFPTKLEKTYVSNELPSQRRLINVSLIL
jgi:hypothetical protein